MTAPAVSPALARALRTLLGLPADAPWPLPVAVALAQGDADGALRWAWEGCRDPAALRDALTALGLDEAEDEAYYAWARWVADAPPITGWRLDEALPAIAAAIKAAVPCPTVAAIEAAR